jgi:hypothetical protein
MCTWCSAPPLHLLWTCCTITITIPVTITCTITSAEPQHLVLACLHLSTSWPLHLCTSSEPLGTCTWALAPLHLLCITCYATAQSPLLNPSTSYLSQLPIRSDEIYCVSMTFL